MNVLDLFAGIGGFSLGLERAGMTIVGQVEIDPWCRAVLAKHWPDVPRFADVREFDGIDADLICGGPPCQRTSVAAAIQGVRTGATLWPIMRDICARVRPRWIVVEQPAGNARWETAVAGDLARIGYDHARLERSAGARGAPHNRRRVFFVANAVCERCDEVARFRGSPEIETVAWPTPPRGTWRQAGAGNRRMDDGVSDWAYRLRALGNAVVPQVVEEIGRAIMAADQSEGSSPSPGGPKEALQWEPS